MKMKFLFLLTALLALLGNASPVFAQGTAPVRETFTKED
jgi:hypothetical protein